MNKSKIVMTALIVLIVSSCIAQTKNTKTDTAYILGNCGMCKSTIEKAANLKKEATIDWDKDTKMAILKYDSLKTTKSEILKRIALVGYDNESFLAPDDTYAKLSGCCQYEREKKSDLLKSNMVNTHSENKMNEMNHTEVAKDSNISSKSQVKKEDLKLVFDNYFKLKDSLIQSNQKVAANASTELLTSINTVKINELEMEVHMVWMNVLEDMKQDATTISTANAIERQRKAFISLSEKMYQLAKVIKVGIPIYFQHCPMANEGKGANWLSKEKEVKNPYYGSTMLSCGKVVETIK
jgi:hypothetical protein